eukprot:TRINITY_DN10421_c0_g1_i1.p1 TRINITY_DN10421_c0_g1~~TRINITY_DN10421_c0_g1_i1.p1  ORF type:complete len:668 (+),score=110.41 TRINITY_DN10421_c0_g1_i1:145-2004(+)
MAPAVGLEEDAVALRDVKILPDLDRAAELWASKMEEILLRTNQEFLQKMELLLGKLPQIAETSQVQGGALGQANENQANIQNEHTDMRDEIRNDVLPPASTDDGQRSRRSLRVSVISNRSQDEILPVRADDEQDSCSCETSPAEPRSGRRSLQSITSHVNRVSSLTSLSSMTTTEEKTYRVKILESQKKSTMSSDALQGGTSGVCNRLGKRLQRIVASWRFEVFFSISIIANSFLLGVHVQYMAAYRDGDAPVILTVLQQFFAYLFTVELIFRICAEGRRFFYSSPNLMWNYLDLMVVATSLMEVALLMHVESPFDTAPNGPASGSNVRIMRMLRIVKILRIVRIVKVVKIIRALRTLIQSIMYTLSVLVWSFVLLTMVIYAFGLVFADATTTFLNAVPVNETQKAAQDKLASYFGDLHISMHTLFQCITNGTSWTDTFWALVEINWFLGYVFVLYIVFSMLAVLNSITGTFCQSAIEGASRDREMLVQDMLDSKRQQAQLIKDLLQTIQEDWQSGGSDCNLTLYSFEKQFEDPKVRTFFQSLDLEASDAWTLFKLMDTDGTGNLNADDFVNGCLRLKGAARSVDVAVMLSEQRRMRKRVDKIWEKLHGPATHSTEDDS